MKIINYSPSISNSSTEESKPISDDKSPSDSSPIPAAMLRSLCPVRISYRMPFNSCEVVPCVDYRFTEWDSKMHYDHTSLEDGSSLEVDTQRVSKYVIHRLIRSSSYGKVVEISGHCPHGEFEHHCIFFKGVDFDNLIWGSKLELNRKFHNERVERFVKPKMRDDEHQRKMAAIQRDIAALQRRLDAKERGESKSNLRDLDELLGYHKLC